MRISPVKIFYYFFITIGGALLIFGVYYIYLSNEARFWPSVEGTIVYTRIRTHTSTLQRSTHGVSSSRKSYYPEITYSWTFSGESYKGTRYGFGYSHPDYSERAEAENAEERFRLGQAITVFYDPNSPADAVIDRSQRVVAFIPLLMGCFFLAVGLVFLKVSPQLEEGYRRYMEAQRKQT